MDSLSHRVASLALVVTALVSCGEPEQPTSTADENSAPPESTAAAPASFKDVVVAVEDRVAVYDGIATGVIALVRIGDETEVVTGGLADVESGEATEPDQTFPIASITKPMTATLVLQLVEDGLLALSEPAQKWLPELREIGDPITVEQLLSHRSGLPDSTDADIRQVGTDTVALLERSAAHGLDFPPGTDGRYVNIGYGALGLLVERVLDQPFDTLLEEQVFDPAEMASASLGGRPDVQGYADGKPVADYHLELLPAAGSVVATVGDVDAFFRALWAGELVAPGLVASMQESRGPITVDQFWRPDYSLGLIHYDVSCGLALGHSGRIGGFTNEAWTLEGADRSVVVTVNDDSSGDVARSIVETALCS